MRNRHVEYSTVLALILSVTLGLACVQRDWSVCSPQDQCQTGYTCTADWKCLLDVDGGADALLAVDSQGMADGAIGLDRPVVADTAVGPAIRQDGSEPDSVPVSAPPDAEVSVTPGLDGPEPDRVPLAAPADAPVDKPPAEPADAAPDALAAGSPMDTPAADAPAAGNSPDALAAGGPLDAPPPDAPPTGPALECVKRSDCAGTCKTCTNGICAAVKSQDDPGVCAGTCDATGACKSKQGQTCKLASDCAGGIPCADGYCCDRACGGSCEACDVANSLGICTTLAATDTPHKGHTACMATDSACAGSCNGSSAACSYPTSACGTASCTGTSYQAAGTCSNGACNTPAAQTCTNACVATAGCADCTPNAVRCSASGLPQRCSSSGTWQNQTACANGNTCSSGSCGCSNTTCGSFCVVLATDAKNCGSCGHDCLGGTCSGGQCGAAVVVANPGASPSVIGVDSDVNGYVYYQGNDPGSGAIKPYRVSKTGTGSPSPLDVGGDSAEYLGVIGSTLSFDLEGEFKMCEFSSSDPTHCLNSYSSLPDSPPGILVPFKSPSPQYLPIYKTDGSFSISWYTTSATQVKTFDESTSANMRSSFAFGDAVYWILDESDSTPTHPDSTVYSVSADVSYPTAARLTGLMAPSYKIIDGNALSLLLAGPSGLYRVRLPDGDAANPPQFIVGPVSSSGSIVAATEDPEGIYWLEYDGSLYSCSQISNCGGSKKALASGQVLAGSTNVTWPLGLYQDASALYWANWAASQIMRLAK